MIAYNKLMKYFILLSIWISFVGLSPQGKNSTLECNPAINFKGRVTSLCQKDPIVVEKITISGEYDNIKLYELTCSDDIDPSLNTSKIPSLRDIKSLTVVDLGSENPTSKSRKFKNREYLQVDIDWKVSQGANKSINSYLIDSTSSVICVEKKDKISVKKEIGLKGLVKLEIDSWVDERISQGS